MGEVNNKEAESVGNPPDGGGKKGPTKRARLHRTILVKTSGPDGNKLRVL